MACAWVTHHIAARETIAIQIEKCRLAQTMKLIQCCLNSIRVGQVGE